MEYKKNSLRIHDFPAGYYDFAGAATNYKKIPKFPSAERDLAVLVPEQLSNENIENIIRQAGNKHLENYIF